MVVASVVPAPGRPLQHQHPERELPRQAVSRVQALQLARVLPAHAVLAVRAALEVLEDESSTSAHLRISCSRIWFPTLTLTSAPSPISLIGLWQASPWAECRRGLSLWPTSIRSPISASSAVVISPPPTSPMWPRSRRR